MPSGDQDGAAEVERLRLLRFSAGLDFQIRIRAMIAIGMLIQKIARQVHSVR